MPQDSVDVLPDYLPAFWNEGFRLFYRVSLREQRQNLHLAFREKDSVSCRVASIPLIFSSLLLEAKEPV